MTLTLITATRDSPPAFALCERWMAAQTLRPLPGRWIVVDDGDQPARCTMGQLHMHRRRREGEPAHTLGLNLLLALDYIQTDRVLFIEHDDYYPPNYVAEMNRLLDDADLVGTHSARYYDVVDRAWCVRFNTWHAATFATGLRRSLLTTLAAVCTRRADYIEIGLWRGAPSCTRKCLVAPDAFPATPVGIKRLPGCYRSTISRNGRWSADPRLAKRDAEPDADGSVLRSWISSHEDRQVYECIPREIANVPGDAPCS